MWAQEIVNTPATIRVLQAYRSEIVPMGCSVNAIKDSNPNHIVIGPVLPDGSQFLTGLDAMHASVPGEATVSFGGPSIVESNPRYDKLGALLPDGSRFLTGAEAMRVGTLNGATVSYGNPSIAEMNPNQAGLVTALASSPMLAWSTDAIRAGILSGATVSFGGPSDVELKPRYDGLGVVLPDGSRFLTGAEAMRVGTVNAVPLSLWGSSIVEFNPGQAGLETALATETRFIMDAEAMRGGTINGVTIGFGGSSVVDLKPRYDGLGAVLSDGSRFLTGAEARYAGRFDGTTVSLGGSSIAQLNPRFEELGSVFPDDSRFKWDTDAARATTFNTITVSLTNPCFVDLNPNLSTFARPLQVQMAGHEIQLWNSGASIVPVVANSIEPIVRYVDQPWREPNEPRALDLERELDMAHKEIGKLGNVIGRVAECGGVAVVTDIFRRKHPGVRIQVRHNTTDTGKETDGTITSSKAVWVIEVSATVSRKDVRRVAARVSATAKNPRLEGKMIMGVVVGVYFRPGLAEYAEEWGVRVISMLPPSDATDDDTVDNFAS